MKGFLLDIEFPEFAKKGLNLAQLCLELMALLVTKLVVGPGRGCAQQAQFREAPEYEPAPAGEARTRSIGVDGLTLQRTELTDRP